ncbi:MAG: hypothetical protein E5W65_24385 [Mesorhizobium sp.]|uniref:hypothetical protein n=1 Tax=Mesorhizobium sp. TaxID=1871066 RepID=UPI001225C380|nr:hypothetical protein [Mesorhizobium sp.]TIT32632.1 MAG: hypothetical protein E5W65_24385 [Mesorhizobium sp.]
MPEGFILQKDDKTDNWYAFENDSFLKLGAATVTIKGGSDLHVRKFAAAMNAQSPVPSMEDEELAREIALWCYIATPENPAMGQTPTAELNIAKVSALLAKHRPTTPASETNEKNGQ